MEPRASWWSRWVALALGLGAAAAAVAQPTEAGASARVSVDLQGLEEEVLVSAARRATRLEDQPLRVEVIDREEIEEKALMTPGSVAMLLGETTGLRVQVTAPSMGASNVRVQGLRGHYSQLLADGLPLYGERKRFEGVCHPIHAVHSRGRGFGVGVVEAWFGRSWAL